MKRIFGNSSGNNKVTFIFFLILITVLVFSTDANAQRRGYGRGGGFYYGGHSVGVRHGYFYAPPIGTRIRVLPLGYVSFWMDGLEYFYYDGLYYRYFPDDGVYVVVEKPKGAEKASNLKFDQVKMYDGSVLEGVFAGATDSTITLKIGDKDHDINISDIISINFAPTIQSNTKQDNTKQDNTKNK